MIRWVLAGVLVCALSVSGQNTCQDVTLSESVLTNSPWANCSQRFTEHITNPLQKDDIDRVMKIIDDGDKPITALEILKKQPTVLALVILSVLVGVGLLIAGLVICSARLCCGVCGGDKEEIPQRSSVLLVLIVACLLGCLTILLYSTVIHFESHNLLIENLNKLSDARSHLQDDVGSILDNVACRVGGLSASIVKSIKAEATVIFENSPFTLIDQVEHISRVVSELNDIELPSSASAMFPQIAEIKQYKSIIDNINVRSMMSSALNELDTIQVDQNEILLKVKESITDMKSTLVIPGEEELNTLKTYTQETYINSPLIMILFITYSVFVLIGMSVGAVRLFIKTDPRERSSVSGVFGYFSLTGSYVIMFTAIMPLIILAALILIGSVASLAVAPIKDLSVFENQMVKAKVDGMLKRTKLQLTTETFTKCLAVKGKLDAAFLLKLTSLDQTIINNRIDSMIASAKNSITKSFNQREILTNIENVLTELKAKQTLIQMFLRIRNDEKTQTNLQKMEKCLKQLKELISKLNIDKDIDAIAAELKLKLWNIVTEHLEDIVPCPKLYTLYNNVTDMLLVVLATVQSMWTSLGLGCSVLLMSAFSLLFLTSWLFQERT